MICRLFKFLVLLLVTSISLAQGIDLTLLTEKLENNNNHLAVIKQVKDLCTILPEVHRF